MINFEIEPYVEKPDLPWCQIYDIDGTLALRGDRGPYEWDKVHLDNVNKSVHHILKNAIDASTDLIFFFTGRVDEKCRDNTQNWLKNIILMGKKFPSDFKYWFSQGLLMRKNGDFRPDSLIKYEMFNKNIRDKFNVRFVIDDRPSVCRMWRKLGVPLLQVGDPDVEF